MSGEFDFNTIVLIGVLGVEALLLWLALRESSRQDGERSRALLPRLRRDIAQRAEQGRSPDWHYYGNEIDRLFDHRDERLRGLAAAALAVGLGGTILALVLNIFVSSGDKDPKSLIAGMGVALLGSFFGVVSNLAITVVFLPRAQNLFEKASEELYGKLQETSDEHPPGEAFTQTIKDELAEIRQALNKEFAAAFSTAIGEFPAVVKGLAGNMDRLSNVVEDQRQSMGGTLTDLGDCARVIAQSSERLQPAAEQLATLTSGLVDMPERMAESLENYRQSWMQGMHAEHQATLQELKQLLQAVESASQEREQKMLYALTESQGAMESLPQQLADQVVRVADKFGNEFGREARHQVNELSEKLQQQQELLMQRIEQHEDQWRNNIGATVQELFERIGDEVQQRLSGSLQQASQGLESSAKSWADIAGAFEQAHAKWHATQEQALMGWQKTGEIIAQASSQLQLGEGQLKLGVGSLSVAAGHLEQVARVNGEFESKLRQALKTVSDGHLEDLKPIQGALADMLQRLEERSQATEEVLEKQSDFIRSLIVQIVEDRGLLEARSA